MFEICAPCASLLNLLGRPTGRGGCARRMRRRWAEIRLAAASCLAAASWASFARLRSSRQRSIKSAAAAAAASSPSTMDLCTRRPAPSVIHNRRRQLGRRQRSRRGIITPRRSRTGRKTSRRSRSSSGSGPGVAPGGAFMRSRIRPPASPAPRLRWTPEGRRRPSAPRWWMAVEQPTTPRHALQAGPIGAGQSAGYA